jgi:hypothetical protein
MACTEEHFVSCSLENETHCEILDSYIKGVELPRKTCTDLCHHVEPPAFTLRYDFRDADLLPDCLGGSP